MVERRNIDLKTHLTTHIDDFERKAGDIFICMEPSQAYSIQKLVKQNAEQQVTLLGLWADKKRPYLQDPYGLKDEYWYTCLDIIDSGLKHISSKILSSGTKTNNGK